MGSRSLESGLLSRAEPSLLERAGGDRERRSNLEALRGSGSFWSKRERLAVRRSVSSMVDGTGVVHGCLSDEDSSGDLCRLPKCWLGWVGEDMLLLLLLLLLLGCERSGVETGWNFCSAAKGKELGLA